MKITKSQLKQIIKEEMESIDRDGDSDDDAELHDERQQVEELVGDYDFEYPEGGGFFLSLASAAGNFLEPQREKLADELKEACIRILLHARSNTYKAKFPSRN